MEFIPAIPALLYCKLRKRFSAPLIGDWLLPALLMILFLQYTGCDRTQPKAITDAPDVAHSGQLTAASISANSVIQRMVQTYQNLSSYEDRAVVELRYRFEGRPAADQAPLSVGWDRHGNLGLAVYGLRAGPVISQDRLHLSLGDKYPEIQGQILSRAKPDMLRFSWLFSEPIVGLELGAGLAGFPATLDLLLNPQPLDGLLHKVDRMEVHPAQSDSGRQFWLVQLFNGKFEYRFWVDRDTHLLRRMGLPTENLPQEILTDPRVSDIELFIDFKEVRVNQPINWDSFRVSVAPSDLLVSRFVPKMPERDLRGLNQTMPAFELFSPDGKSGFDSTPIRARKASVLIWLANHPACLAASEQLAAVEKTLRASGISEREVEFVSIWAEPQPPQGMTFDQLRSQWRMPGNLVVDPGAAGRDLFHVEEAPTVVILDAEGKLQFKDVRVNPLLDQALPPLIHRLIGGINLAEEIVRAQASVELRYEAELALAGSMDRRSSHPALPQSYPPAVAHLSPMVKRSFDAKVAALFQDQLEVPWVLTVDGVLYQLNASLDSINQIQTTWVIRNQTLPLIKPTADGRFFAYNNGLDSSVDVLDFRTGESVKFQLPESARPSGMYWLKIPAAKVPRLAVLSDNRRIVLLDLENKEQLSGECPERPVAIIGESLTQLDRSELTSSVVLANGRVETIRFPRLSANQAQLHQASQQIRVTGDQKQGDERQGDERQLGFVPAMGPWTNLPSLKASSPADIGRILATGWHSAEEPALFFIDQRLNVYNTYRLPATTAENFALQAAVSTSPINGQSLWAVLDRHGIVHLLQADAKWSDHFRPEKRATGISLIAAGDHLLLLLAHHDELTAYRID